MLIREKATGMHIKLKAAPREVKGITQYCEQAKYSDLLTLYAALFVTILIGILLNHVPNVLDTEHIINTYNIPIELFVPETSEKLQYIVCTLSFPFLYILFHFLFNRITIRTNHQLIDRGLTTLEVAGILFILLCLNSMASKYLSTSTFSNDWWLYNGLTVFTLLLFVLSIRVYDHHEKKSTYAIPLFLLAAAINFLVSRLYVATSYFDSNAIVAEHFDAYFYPVYKVYCGQTPMIDFNCLYGFYPYFIVPLFKLVGGISIHGFSLFVSMIAFVSLCSLAASLFLLCLNKMIAFFGSIALTFTIAILPMIYQDVYYLQYFPHRVISPALLLLLCSIITRFQSHPRIKYLERFGFVFIGLALLWNIDTGLVAFISYCGFLLYLKLYVGFIDFRSFIKYVISVVSFALLSFAMSLLTLYAVTYMRTSIIMDFHDVLYGQTSFYGDGFYMIRMSIIDFWPMLIGVYVIGLVKALRELSFMRRGTPVYSRAISASYFLLSILGLGLFSYYQGRSHEYVFPLVVWPGIFLLILFNQEYAGSILRIPTGKSEARKTMQKNAIPLFKFLCSGLIISFLFISLAINMLDESRLVEAKAMNGEGKNYALIEDAIKLYDAYKIQGSPIDLVMYNAAAVYCIKVDKNMPNIPATIDLFTKEDYAKCIEYLGRTTNTVVFDTRTYKLLDKYCAADFEQLFLNRYRQVETQGQHIVFQTAPQI